MDFLIQDPKANPELELVRAVCFIYLFFLRLILKQGEYGLKVGERLVLALGLSKLMVSHPRSSQIEIEKLT